MEEKQIDKHIAVLDGLRVISLIIIVWLHFWEQTWLTPYINFNNRFTRYFGITESHLQIFVRFGAVFTDFFILLSAICNFWPYARAIVLKEEWPDTKTFFKKRAIRILPSYYLNVIVMFILALVQHKYTSKTFMFKDLIMNLTFTSIWSDNVYVNTVLNGVLWTVQVEVWFYLLIPLLAKLLKKFSGLTCVGLWLCGIITSNVVIYNFSDNIRGWANHPLMYTGFYANGMLICLCYATIKKKGGENKYTYTLAAMFAFASIVGLTRLLQTFEGQDKDYMKVATRFEFMMLFSLLTMALMLAGPVVSRMMSNRFFHFINVISYNLYIWHQVIAFQCKENRIPYWEGDMSPNMLGDTVWARQYQVIILIITLIVAVLVTYGFEKPITKYFQKRLK